MWNADTISKTFGMLFFTLF